MTQPSAHTERSEKTSGRRLDERSNPGRTALTARELVDRLEIRERLSAVLSELDLLDADVDVPRTIAEGLLEEIVAAVATT
jgi:hypothetical protein